MYNTTHELKTIGDDLMVLQEYIEELRIAQQHVESIDEWNEIERQIKELEMQYKDEDGDLQWL